jgi:hypothetical protein
MISRGDVCANGAVVVDCKKAWDESGYVVLCLWTKDTAGAEHFIRTADPYVTWFARQEEGAIRCTNGHYHDQLSEAVVDFNNRI